MTEDKIRAIVLESLGRVAPEADLSSLGTDEDIRRTLDIDSFDLLRFLVSLHESLEVEIPEADHGSLTTLRGILRYVCQRKGIPSSQPANPGTHAR